VHFGRTGLSPRHLFPLLSSLFSLSIDLPREQGRKKRNTSASPGGKEEGGGRRRGREQVIDIAQLLFFLFPRPFVRVFSSGSFCFALTGEETKRKGSDLELSSDGTHTRHRTRTRTPGADLGVATSLPLLPSAEPNIMADGEEEAYFQNQREDETEHALRERN
jgi:hypothetical protein